MTSLNFSVKPTCFLLGMVLHGIVLADNSTPVIIRTISELLIYPETTAAAQVVSLNETAVSAQVEGTVDKIAVKVGDQIKEGGVLVKLSCVDLELERERLKAEREALMAKLELSSWQVKQIESLTSQRTLPQEKLKEKHAEFAAIKAEINAQSFKIMDAERQAAYCLVKAPFTGVVTKRDASTGQFVSRGSTLIHLLDLHHTEVSAQVASTDLKSLQEAKRQFLEHNGLRFPLKLRAILPAIQSQSGTQEIRLDFTGLPAKPGTAGRLVWQSIGDYLSSEHLLKRSEGYGIFTVQSGKAHFIILPDAQAGKPVAVNLPSDTPVIVSGQYGLSEGSAVTIQNPEKTGSVTNGFISTPANTAP